VIAQSVAFVYAPGKKPHDESDPLNTDASARRTVEGIVALEEAVTKTRGVEGVVLRYGRLYGPGTWAAKPTGKGFVHVEAAAQAAALAVMRGRPGIYNIAEDNGEVSIARARKAFGFDPKFRATA
jgi:nucleoside-diphosphate-sugar epimerase